MISLKTLFVQAPLLVALVVPCCGGAPPEWSGARPSSEFQISSGLVLVPVTVTDRRGAHVPGLGKESFTVLDDRRPQPITTFYSEESPCSVGFVVDASGSVKDRLGWEKEAVHYILELANPEDTFFVAVVSSSPAILGPPSDDVGAIQDQVRALKAGGWTALFDTIHLAAARLKDGRPNCRGLVVLSDGMDNHSQWTRNALMESLMETDIQVYTIAVEGTRTSGKAVDLSEPQRGVAFMQDLAENTGGLSVAARDSQNPAGPARSISAALRNRYVIGYRMPDDAAPDKWHTIRVKVDRSRLNVYARGGYRNR